MPIFAQRNRQLPQSTIVVTGIQNLPGENRLEVKNEGNETHLYLTGQVGSSYWDMSGITEDETRAAINSIPKGTKFHAHINSEGGEVKTGLGIYNAIKERSEDCTAHIDGYALSIASVIPLAAHKVISPKSAIWMIHNASCGTYGDDEEMDKASRMLKEHNIMLSEIYNEHTGKSKKDILADMKSETWIRGSEAVEYGLADECDEDDCSNRMAKIPKSLLERCKNIPSNIYNFLLSGNEAGQPQQKTNTNIMNKQQMIALLNSWGVKLTGTETDDQLVTLVTAGKPAAPVATTTSTFDAQAAFNKLQTDRVRDKVTTYVDAGKITKAEIAIYVTAAMADEIGTFKILDEKQVVTIGGEHAGSGIELGRETEAPSCLVGRSVHLTEAVKNMAAEFKSEPNLAVRKQKVYDALKANWEYLQTDARRRDAVKNENTFSSSLTTNFLILGATVQLSPKFAAIPMFSRDTSVDPYKPLATGQLKFNTTAQDGSTTQTNATNFESGDSTVTNVAVTVAQYTEAFHLTNSQLNSGLRMEDLVISKMASLGSKISKVFAANITAANFSTLTPIINSSTAFGFRDTQVAWGALKKAVRKHLMLDGPYLANLINVPTLFQPTPVVPGASWKNLIGWDYVALHTEWSAAGANIFGFGGDPQALGVIAGLPLIDSPAIPGGILAQATGMLPGVDLPIAVYAWFNTATRTYWASYDMMFGANALDTTAGIVFASGQPT